MSVDFQKPKTKKRHRGRGYLAGFGEENFNRNAITTSDYLENLDDEKFLEALSIPDDIHRKLFEGCADPKKRIGNFREAAMRVTYFTEGRVLSQIVMANPEDVSKSLKLYSDFLKRIHIEKPTKEELSFFLAGAVYWFFFAHPFVDGNGRTLRFILRAFCERFGYTIGDNWTVYERPYDTHFSYSIRNYPNNPFLLIGGLRQFFEPIEISLQERDGDGVQCHYECMNFRSQNYMSCLRNCLGSSGPSEPSGPSQEELEQEAESYLRSLMSELEES